ncbi:SIR2 family protein [Natronorubrum thiooxidans]|uniref:SIR2-like domain-containing protein n=1 Tax=Natronorubrum thiooxidans TaxID=308853 RepID=A0A1N7GPQ7_9EURY|nr:SIR2 family protein [Natronorubrum thiooxidans]SIS14562.1 SIR2-like domain-containing protein [Natronorubrum thiooxidans]
MPQTSYGEYIDTVSSAVEEKVEEMTCQPILFVGSGISRRYFDGPDWLELLEEMAEQCPTAAEIGYYTQKGMDETKIGEQLADAYYEWAFEDKSQFPSKLYDGDNYGEDIFLKHSICEHLKEKSPESIEDIDEQYHEEIELLQDISPQSIITTNYDPLLEVIFPEYEPIIGEEVLRSPHQSVGEIYKIHGCVSDPDSLVLTAEDYNNYDEKKKYLTAKLLTYFAEHPVLFTGYGVGDRNVKKILSDLDEVLAPDENEAVENLYFLKWKDDISELAKFDYQKRFQTVGDRTIILNYIVASGFEWVFRAFGSGGSIEGVNLKLLRTVMANTYDIIAEKAPRKEVNINYESLKTAADSEDNFATVFGVSMMDDPPDANVLYRYRLTDISNELGYDTWHPMDDNIEKIEQETGIDIRDFNNRYHMDIAFHSDYPQHRYSEAGLRLLKKVENGEEWILDISRDLPESSIEEEEPEASPA